MLDFGCQQLFPTKIGKQDLIFKGITYVCRCSHKESLSQAPFQTEAAQKDPTIMGKVNRNNFLQRFMPVDAFETLIFLDATSWMNQGPASGSPPSKPKPENFIEVILKCWKNQWNWGSGT